MADVPPQPRHVVSDDVVVVSKFPSPFHGGTLDTFETLRKMRNPPRVSSPDDAGSKLSSLPASSSVRIRSKETQQEKETQSLKPRSSTRRESRGAVTGKSMKDDSPSLHSRKRPSTASASITTKAQRTTTSSTKSTATGKRDAQSHVRPRTTRGTSDASVRSPAKHESSPRRKLFHHDRDDDKTGQDEKHRKLQNKKVREEEEKEEKDGYSEDEFESLDGEGGIEVCSPTKTAREGKRAKDKTPQLASEEQSSLGEEFGLARLRKTIDSSHDPIPYDRIAQKRVNEFMKKKKSEKKDDLAKSSMDKEYVRALMERKRLRNHNVKNIRHVLKEQREKRALAEKKKQEEEARKAQEKIERLRKLEEHRKEAFSRDRMGRSSRVLKKKSTGHKASKGRKTKRKTADTSGSFGDTSSSMTSDRESTEYQISKEEAQIIVKSCQELLRRRFSESLKSHHSLKPEHEEKEDSPKGQFSDTKAVEKLEKSSVPDHDASKTHDDRSSPLLRAWEDKPTTSKEQEIMWSRLMSIRTAAMELKHRIERDMEDISQEETDLELTGATRETTRDDAYDDDTIISSDPSMVEMTPVGHRPKPTDHVLHDEVPARPDSTSEFRHHQASHDDQSQSVHDVGASFGLYDPGEGRKLREENAVLTIQSWARGCNTRSRLAKQKRKETARGHKGKSSPAGDGVREPTKVMVHDLSKSKRRSTMGETEPVDHESHDDIVVEDSILDEVDAREDESMDQRNTPSPSVDLDPIIEMEKEVSMQEQQPSSRPIAISVDSRDLDKQTHKDLRYVDIAADAFTIVKVIQKKHLQRQLEMSGSSSSKATATSECAAQTTDSASATHSMQDVQPSASRDDQTHDERLSHSRDDSKMQDEGPTFFAFYDRDVVKELEERAKKILSDSSSAHPARPKAHIRARSRESRIDCHGESTVTTSDETLDESEFDSLLSSSGGYSSDEDASHSQERPRPLSPNAMFQKYMTYQNMLSALEESERNLGELERARSLTMAQQETVTISRAMQMERVKTEHEKEVEKMKRENEERMDKMKQEYEQDVLKYKFRTSEAQTIAPGFPSQSVQADVTEVPAEKLVKVKETPSERVVEMDQKDFELDEYSSDFESFLPADPSRSVQDSSAITIPEDTMILDETASEGDSKQRRRDEEYSKTRKSAKKNAHDALDTMDTSQHEEIDEHISRDELSVEMSVPEDSHLLVETPDHSIGKNTVSTHPSRTSPSSIPPRRSTSSPKREHKEKSPSKLSVEGKETEITTDHLSNLIDSMAASFNEEEGSVSEKNEMLDLHKQALEMKSKSHLDLIHLQMRSVPPERKKDLDALKERERLVVLEYEVGMREIERRRLELEAESLRAKMAVQEQRRRIQTMFRESSAYQEKVQKLFAGEPVPSSPLIPSSAQVDRNFELDVLKKRIQSSEKVRKRDDVSKIRRRKKKEKLAREIMQAKTALERDESEFEEMSMMLEDAIMHDEVLLERNDPHHSSEESIAELYRKSLSGSVEYLSDSSIVEAIPGSADRSPKVTPRSPLSPRPLPTSVEEEEELRESSRRSSVASSGDSELERRVAELEELVRMKKEASRKIRSEKRKQVLLLKEAELKKTLEQYEKEIVAHEKASPLLRAPSEPSGRELENHYTPALSTATLEATPPLRAPESQKGKDTMKKTDIVKKEGKKADATVIETVDMNERGSEENFDETDSIQEEIIEGDEVYVDLPTTVNAPGTTYTEPEDEYSDTFDTYDETLTSSRTVHRGDEDDVVKSGRFEAGDQEEDKWKEDDQESSIAESIPDLIPEEHFDNDEADYFQPPSTEVAPQIISSDETQHEDHEREEKGEDVDVQKEPRDTHTSPRKDMEPTDKSELKTQAPPHDIVESPSRQNRKDTEKSPSATSQTGRQDGVMIEEDTAVLTPDHHKLEEGGRADNGESLGESLDEEDDYDFVVSSPSGSIDDSHSSCDDEKESFTKMDKESPHLESKETGKEIDAAVGIDLDEDNDAESVGESIEESIDEELVEEFDEQVVRNDNESQDEVPQIVAAERKPEDISAQETTAEEAEEDGSIVADHSVEKSEPSMSENVVDAVEESMSDDGSSTSHREAVQQQRIERLSRIQNVMEAVWEKLLNESIFDTVCSTENASASRHESEGSINIENSVSVVDVTVDSAKIGDESSPHQAEHVPKEMPEDIRKTEDTEEEKEAETQQKQKEEQEQQHERQIVEDTPYLPTDGCDAKMDESIIGETSQEMRRYSPVRELVPQPEVKRDIAMIEGKVVVPSSSKREGRKRIEQAMSRLSESLFDNIFTEVVEEVELLSMHQIASFLQYWYTKCRDRRRMIPAWRSFKSFIIKSQRRVRAKLAFRNRSEGKNESRPEISLKETRTDNAEFPLQLVAEEHRRIDLEAEEDDTSKMSNESVVNAITELVFQSVVDDMVDDLENIMCAKKLRDYETPLLTFPHDFPEHQMHEERVGTSEDHRQAEMEDVPHKSYESHAQTTDRDAMMKEKDDQFFLDEDDEMEADGHVYVDSSSAAVLLFVDHVLECTGLLNATAASIKQSPLPSFSASQFVTLSDEFPDVGEAVYWHNKLVFDATAEAVRVFYAIATGKTIATSAAPPELANFSGIARVRGNLRDFVHRVVSYWCSTQIESVAEGDMFPWEEMKSREAQWNRFEIDETHIKIDIADQLLDRLVDGMVREWEEIDERRRQRRR